MFDSTIFFSLYLALVSAFITMEVFNLVLGFFMSKIKAKHQQTEQKDFETEFNKAIAEGRMPPGISPTGMLMGPEGQMVPFNMPMPCSGGGRVEPEEEAEFEKVGQYL